MSPGKLAALAALPALMGCKTAHDFPPKADVQAVTEAKPMPPATILTDPGASDRYNAELEDWGERVRGAGVRLCRHLQSQGMEIDCPED